ncbi:unnamed protein product [Adineta ricciae]|uniref:Hydroxylysine kinase n=2 Tax=Adineta ricciae TaxID=249248 RepID=A0A814FPS6_ADIRI|nr:unnamed protein product [Adineta ricciae]
MSNELRHLSPEFSIDEAKKVANEYYKLKEFVSQLPSERDQNFLFQNDDQTKFILKISNIDEDHSVLDMQICAIQRFNSQLRTVPSLDGQMIITYKNHYIRLVTYIPGTPLARFQPHSRKLLINLGKTLGQLDQSLEKLDHPSMNRDLYWNMNNAEKIINAFKYLITEKNRYEIIEDILRRWVKFVRPCLPSLRTSVIHNDANDYNIIVHDEETVNLIDFGDLCRSYVVSEVAIACAYVMLDKNDPISAASYVLCGYQQIYPLEPIEVDLIYYFILMRLAMSVTISAHQKQSQPNNEYIVISEKPAWSLLEKLNDLDFDSVRQTIRSVCNSSN